MEALAIVSFESHSPELDQLERLLAGLNCTVQKYQDLHRTQINIRHSLFIVDPTALPDTDTHAIEGLLEIDPGATFLIYTPQAIMNSKLASLMHRAYDFIQKPADPENLYLLIERALNHVRRRSQLLTLTDGIASQIKILSVAERKIALRCAVYHENSEIAQVSHLSVRTVEGHRLNINHKLGKQGAKGLYRDLAQYMIGKYPYRLPNLFNGLNDEGIVI